MANAELRVGSIAANLANVSTPGYKRVQSALQRFEVPGEDGRSARTALVPAQTTSFAQGIVKNTGRDLDFALRGDGFFVLDGEEGETLTRNGVFLISDQGELVSDEGTPVAWQTRSGQLDPSVSLTVSGEGEVLQGERVIGKLALRAYKDTSLLEPTGNGDFKIPFELEELTPDVLVIQSALEGSNSVAIDQLVNMITAQRSYERSAQVVKTISENYQRLSRPF